MKLPIAWIAAAFAAGILLAAARPFGLGMHLGAPSAAVGAAIACHRRGRGSGLAQSQCRRMDVRAIGVVRARHSGGGN